MHKAVFAWTLFFVMVGVFIALWYMTEPVAYLVADTCLNLTRDSGYNTTGLEQGIALIKTLNVLWVGVACVVAFIWAMAVSFQREGVGMYG